MSKPIDIREPLSNLCEILGIDRTATTHIAIEPAHVVAVVCKRNANGKLYAENGQTATETLTFCVTT